MPLLSGVSLGLMWSPPAINASVIGANVLLLCLSLLLNLAVLFLLHAGKIRLSDIATITVFTNALADLLSLPIFVTTDFCLPLLVPSALPFMCKFRLYTYCVCYGGNSLILAALFFSHRNRMYAETFGKAPCGIFIFPALVWFLSFSFNIWTLVLYECRIAGFLLTHDPTPCGFGPAPANCSAIFVAVSFLQTKSRNVQRCLFTHSLLTVLVPLLLCFAFLARTRRPAAGSPSRRLRLGVCLLVLNVLLVCPKLLARLTSIYLNNSGATVSEALVITELVTRSLFYLHMAMKPAVFFFFHPDIKDTALLLWRTGCVGLPNRNRNRTAARQAPHIICVDAPSFAESGVDPNEHRRASGRRWTALSVDCDFDSCTSSFVVPNHGALSPLQHSRRSSAQDSSLRPPPRGAL